LSYKTTIPNPGDFLAISQKQILANYQAIYSAFSRNHVSMDSNNNVPGYHTSFTMPRQSVDPTTGSTQVALYNKFDANMVPQLFYRPNNNQTPIQMTNSNSSVISSPTQFRQSTFLAGPFTLYVGYIRNATDGQLVVLTPSTTLKYVGLISVTNSANGALATNITSNQFVVRFGGTAPAARTIYYMAIGLS